MAIRVLDAATVGRIAAGEVVERPSSVAKELIENSLDAGATSVTVEISGGGIEMLRVTDNGYGIAPNEARMAFENHATSKLRRAEDLDDIRTLGFRGEALPSVASVAKVEMTTRVKGAPSGVRLRIEGGRFVDVNEAGCPEGTTIVVRDLFYNTPVRQAFLKKPTYEAGVLIDLVQRMMLGNPNASIRLISNKKTVCQSYGDGSVSHAALAVYGREIASKLMEIDETEGGLRLRGLIGIEDCAKANRGGQSFFINGRLVRCPLLSQALENACRGRVTIGMYPMCALHVTVPPYSVDVNVHPSKMEVRFRDEVAMRASADALLERAFPQAAPMLSEQTIVGKEKTIVCKPPVQVEIRIPELPAEKREEKTDVGIQKQADAGGVRHIVQNIAPDQQIATLSTSGQYGAIREAGAAMPTQRREPAKEAPFAGIVRDSIIEEARSDAKQTPDGRQETPAKETRYRVIGVAFDTYLLVETPDALLLIDQHAAHERILYTQYTHSLDMGVASQPLLAPVILPVTRREQAVLAEQKELLEAAGYSIEPFGERDVQVRAVPFILGKAELQPLFLEMIDRLDQLKNAALDKRRAEIIQLSCKRAVKGGDRLKDSEIAALIAAMETTEAPATCPHGRPVLRVFSKNELERMFKRQQ